MALNPYFWRSEGAVPPPPAAKDAITDSPHGPGVEMVALHQFRGVNNQFAVGTGKHRKKKLKVFKGLVWMK